MLVVTVVVHVVVVVIIVVMVCIAREMAMHISHSHICDAHGHMMCVRRKWAREEADIRMAVLPFLDTEYCLQ